MNKLETQAPQQIFKKTYATYICSEKSVWIPSKDLAILCFPIPLRPTNCTDEEGDNFTSNKREGKNTFHLKKKRFPNLPKQLPGFCPEASRSEKECLHFYHNCPPCYFSFALFLFEKLGTNLGGPRRDLGTTCYVSLQYSSKLFSGCFSRWRPRRS